MKKVIKYFIIAIVCLGLLGVCIYSWESQQQLTYGDCLEETAFEVDGEFVEMKWLAFYIIYEEREVEQQAMIYNPDCTADYWNLHINGVFIREDARDTIMKMAVHDYLFYCEAVKAGLQLDATEQRRLENTEADFWMDLLDEQADNLPVSDEYLVETMRRIALAEKYQAQLARQEGHSYTSYSWNGGYYNKWLETQDVTINDKIWDRISVGNITLTHDKVNYINGYEKKDSE